MLIYTPECDRYSGGREVSINNTQCLHTMLSVVSTQCGNLILYGQQASRARVTLNSSHYDVTSQTRLSCLLFMSVQCGPDKCSLYHMVLATTPDYRIITRRPSTAISLFLAYGRKIRFKNGKNTYRVFSMNIFDIGNWFSFTVIIFLISQHVSLLCGFRCRRLVII